MDIQVEGPKTIVEAAPIDKLKEQLMKLLNHTTVRAAVLNIIKHIHPYEGADVTVQHPMGDAVQILIQEPARSDGQSPQRYKCSLQSANHTSQALRQELLDAEKKVAGLRVRVVQSFPSLINPRKYVRKPKKNGEQGEANFLSGWREDPAKQRKILSYIIPLADESGMVDSTQITDALINDLKLPCQRKGVGTVFQGLRHKKFLKPIEKQGRVTIYEITDRARNFVVGKKPSAEVEQPRAVVSPLVKQVQELENMTADCDQLLGEIQKDEQALVHKRDKLTQMKIAKTMLEDICKMMKQFQEIQAKGGKPQSGDISGS